MDMSDLSKRLLERAADFIERHPNGVDPMLKELMAGACRQAAGVKPAVKAVAAPEPHGDKTGEDTVGVLLQAAGWKRIKRSPRRVYGFLLEKNQRAWDAGEVAGALNMDRKIAGNTLSKLHRAGAIERIGLGQYKAK